MKIVYNTENLNTNQQNNLSSCIKEYFENTQLNLTSLEKLLITSNLFGDVLEVQKHFGMDTREASNNENAKAVAKVITSRKEKEIKSVVVVDEIEVKKILSTDPKEQMSGFHVIHHELVHVHDDLIKNNTYTEEERRGTNTDVLTHFLRVVADEIWAEYIAERLSATSSNREHIDRLLELLKLQGSNLVTLFEIERKKYFKHKDTLQAFNNVSETMKYFLKTIAMIIGNLDGDCEDDLKSVLEEGTLNFIGDSNFLVVYKNMKNVLSSMFLQYPNWNDISILDSLGKEINNSWLWLGFRLVPLGNSYRVDIRTTD